jgi:hypothetical protein
VNRVRGKSHFDLLLRCAPHPCASNLLQHGESAFLPL